MSVALNEPPVDPATGPVLEGPPPAAQPAAAPAAAPVDPNAPKPATIFDAARTPAELAATKAATDAAMVGKLVMPERPAWLPEKFYDAKTGEIRVQDLAANEAHLRGLVSKGDHKPPAAADAYKVEFAAEQAPLKAEYEAMVAAKDPLLVGVQEAAFKAGLSNAQFQEVTKAYLSMAMELAPPPLDPAKELAKLGKNGPALVRAHEDLGKQLVKHGIFSDDEFDRWLAIASDADGMMLVRKVLEYHGRSPIEVDAQHYAANSVTAASVRAEQDALIQRRNKGEHVSEAEWEAVQEKYRRVYGDAPSGRSALQS